MKIRLLITSLRIPELFREKSVFIDGTQIYMPTNKSKLCCHMSSTLRLNTAKPSCVGVTELGLTPSYNLSERVFSPLIRKELIMSTDVDQVKHLNGNNYKMIKGSSFFADINKQLGLLPGFKGLGQDISKLDQETQTPGSTTPMDKVRQTAEVIASDVISTFGGQDNEKKPPNRYCKTMRRTVRELSDRHDIAFKGMVQKLNVNDTNAFPTFVSVVDEIFEDGQINWGRIVAVYTFASRLAVHCRKHSPDCDERIALYAGKYVASKLGKWILDNGGWDAFADYFPEQGAMEDKLWKGLMFTAVGLGALATMVAAR